MIEGMASAYMLTSLMGFVGIALVLFFVLQLLSPSRTKKYRRELADLYVAGRIKQIAKEDKIELADEFEGFKNWLKSRRLELESQGLDDTIEEELKEKISNKKKSK